VIEKIIKKINFSGSEIKTDGLRKILFVKLFAIGDCLNATPALRILKNSLPQADIDMLVGDWSASVFQNNPNINLTIKVADNIFRKPDPVRLMRLAMQIRRKKYDAALLFHRDPRLGLFLRATGIPIRIGPDLENDGYWLTHPVEESGVEHEIQIFNTLLKPLGIQSDDTRMELFPSDEEIETAAKLWNESGLNHDSPVIGMAPGGASNPGEVMPQRVWKHYCQLAERLLESGYRVAYFGGKGDLGELENLPKGESVASFIGKATLTESAELMKKCRLVVCHDSGPMHLAAAAGVFTVSIFAPTDPLRKAPLGSQHRYFAVNKECAPCYHRGQWDSECSQACIETITVEQVLCAIEEMLSVSTESG